jgi:hypothetical protein
MENPDQPEAVAVPKAKRRWLRRAAALTGIVLLTIALAPTIAQFGPLRQRLLTAALPGLNGTISAEQATFGWFTPVSVSELVIRDKAGAAVVEVSEIHFNTTLWNMVSNQADLGRLRLRDPRVNVVVTKDKRTNLRDVFGSLRTSGNLVDRLRGHTLDIELIDLEIHVRTEDSSGDWQAGDINFLGRIESAAAAEGKDGTPQLLVKQCKLLDRTELTPGLCNDVLQYVLPPLAGATSPEGAVSVDLKEGAIPLDLPRKLNLTGALTIHDVSVGPGILTQSLTDLLATLQAPTRFQLANNSVIQFAVADERVTHSGLEFGVPQVRVRTEGSVGFDQTLDVIAEVILALGESEKRPILSALGNQNLRVPIRGTFAEPKVELGEIASGNANWMNLLQSAGTLWAKRSAGGTGEATPETESEASGEGGIDAADVLDNLPVGNGEILNWWNERRKQREAERQAAEQQNPQAAEETPPPRRRLRDRLRGRTEQPPPPPPATQ